MSLTRDPSEREIRTRAAAIRRPDSVRVRRVTGIARGRLRVVMAYSCVLDTIGVVSSLRRERVTTRVTKAHRVWRQLTWAVTRLPTTMPGSDRPTRDEVNEVQSEHGRREPTDWPTHPLTGWRARERVADLLEEAATERLARHTSPRRPVVLGVFRTLRFGVARRGAVLRATLRPGRQAPLESIESRCSDPASA